MVTRKHKHHDMIVAKAGNMDLVLFIKVGDDWQISGGHDNQVINIASHYDYFLCLPEHNKDGQCLHWLNGGNVYYKRKGKDNVTSINWPKVWDPSLVWNFSNIKIKIEPKKEKRIVVYDEAAGKFEETAFKTMKDAMEEIKYYDAQFFEIDVEI